MLVWSTAIRVDGVPITSRVWRNRDAPSEIEIVRAGARSLVMSDDLYFDTKPKPYIHFVGKTVVIAFAAFPGAGRGIYASIWKVWDGGQRFKRLGGYRNPDLRQGFAPELLGRIGRASTLPKMSRRRYQPSLPATRLPQCIS